MYRLPRLRHRILAPLAAAHLLALSGCGSLSEGGPPPTPEPLAPDTLVLDINGEKEWEYARGQVLITVQTTGPTPDTVELLHRGKPLATMLPPFQFTWDTTSEEEGAHPLTARAKWSEVTFTSKVHTVVVDRTPPVFFGAFPGSVSSVPFNNQNFGVYFSEAILPSSLPGSQIKYQSNDRFINSAVTQDEFGYILNATHPALESSGYAHTRSAVFHAEGLTDLAGNPLVMPGGADLSWSWNVLAYSHHHVVGSAAGRVAMAAGAGGAHVIAFASGEISRGRNIHVRQWTEKGGGDIGGPLVAGTSTDTTSVRDPVVQVGSDGQPIVAFLQRERDDVGFALHVFRWSSTKWLSVGDRVDAPEDGEVLGAALVLDRLGRPVVAWSTPRGIHAARFETDQWKELGGALPSHAAALAPALAVDPEGRVIVAWVGAVDAQSETGLFVRRWQEDTGWAPVKTGEPIREHDFGPDMTFEAPRVAIDSSGEPLVVWAEHHTYGPGDSRGWICSARVSALDSDWLTSSFDADASGYNVRPEVAPAVAVDTSGREWISWTNRRLKIRDVSHNDPEEAVAEETQAGPAALVVDAEGRTVLAWSTGGVVTVARK
ncbi:hypothetical protein [Pyxidicoccus sp. MSG2]|uniref:hypothetical protein n=1 Tax=Pyxidicoccus sp. MSG2 TaxID=2996790 RepID=UPI0022720001|nr:hypothetical protein [Pyxidicoccus sp. MSG2]MCY1023422.1 hypothetical protein [Pyxidicoccus sp. MSG2]